MKIRILKIGGQILDDENLLVETLKGFSVFPGPKLIIHGGGKLATQIGNRMGIPERYVDGRRITDAQTLELVTMVYGGLINKGLVAKIQSFGFNAIGLCGADVGIIKAHKRPIGKINFEFVGDIEPEYIQTDFIELLLEKEIIPVFSSLTFDPKGSLLNTNADTICSALGAKLAEKHEVDMYFCFDKDGVMNIDQTIYDRLNESQILELSENGIVLGGMLPKLKNAIHAIKAGVKSVTVLSPTHLMDHLEGKPAIGTKITLN